MTMPYVVATTNKKYAKIKVTEKVMRAFARASDHVSVRLFDGKRARLKNHLLVIDIVIDDEVLQQVFYVKDYLPKIKTVAINGHVVAKRESLGQPLLTNGVAWHEYTPYLPRK
jgi:hypothetical protein